MTPRNLRKAVSRLQALETLEKSESKKSEVGLEIISQNYFEERTYVRYFIDDEVKMELTRLPNSEGSVTRREMEAIYEGKR